MKEKVCCILDSDAEFALRLTEYLNEKKLLPMRVMTFTDLEALETAAKKYQLELLISDGQFQTSDLVLGRHIILKETAEDVGEDSIYRYQPAQNLAKAILALSDTDISLFAGKTDGVQILCVYSPAGKSGKTGLAISLAKAAGVQGTALYLNLEEFSAIGGILPDPGKGLSEALYYYHAAGEQAYTRILGCTAQAMGFDYFYPVTCADDMEVLDGPVLTQFLSMFVRGGSYQTLIIDLGNLLKSPWKLLACADRIIMPEPTDNYSRRKTASFESYLFLSGRGDLAERIEKYKVPIYEALPDRQLEQIAERILNGQ